jgi:Ca-activated chloride channel homolog
MPAGTRHHRTRHLIRETFRLFPSLLLVLLLSVPALARRQDDDDVVRVESDLVILNVTVTDAQGRFIRKLRRTDFKVFEDGREQAINSFLVEETPFAAAILLDTSSSMERRISLARAAAIRFLDGLRGDDVTAVYNFNDEVERMQDYSPSRDLPALAYDLKTKGKTSLNDAILLAAKDLAARPEKRRAIVVLSDGIDFGSRASSDKALNAALAAGASIYAVNMIDKVAQPVLQMQAGAALKNFATKSGGRYVATPGGFELGEAFVGIAEELRNQYTISYRPANGARDGRWREIDLKVSRADASARTRKGYRAPKK